MLLTVWSTGRVAVGGLPQGLQPVVYEPSDLMKHEEPVTLRLKLEGRDRYVEVVRGARVIYSL